MTFKVYKSEVGVHHLLSETHSSHYFLNQVNAKVVLEFQAYTWKEALDKYPVEMGWVKPSFTC